MNDALERLKENRDAILLAEFGAYLHLLGKLSANFIEAQSDAGPKGFGYKRILEDNNPIQLPTSLFNLLKDNWLKQHLKVECVANRQEIQGPNNFRAFIEEHGEDDEKWKSRVEWLQLMAASHRHASTEEKESHGQKWLPQPSKERTWTASAFGFEIHPLVQIINPKDVRNNLCNGLIPYLKEIEDKKDKNETINWMEIYYGKKENNKETSLLTVLREAFSKSTAETRRPINDVTLWDQTYATASYLKSGAAGVTIKSWKKPTDSGET